MGELSWLTSRPIAHRGLHDMNKTRWENTRAAFRAAVERNYTIECDVHLASDGVPVVFHDEELARLTGGDGRIWQRTSAEMGALRVGGTAEQVPTLSQLLELVSGAVPLIIELKGVAGHDTGLVDAVLGSLSSYKGHAALMSFDHWIVRDLGRKSGNLPVGLTATGSSPSDMEAHFSMLANGLSFVSYDVSNLPNAFVSFVRERLSLPVITWTVRNAEDAQKTLRYADQMTFEGFDP
ncbi:glycerophosphodiester phosphodiesterase [Chelativorans sp. Marseille-P2723]|uniref:glycerophosphodiester phosphodiesterase n=1 Tax=Chelativorans sp. Marseille-P2723 TaxID=2709133 RepID=UPI0015707657|nr:glycerophosphodiester phosphodiesterase [Chelativorans sp. Marseille-P2723]